MASFFSQEDEDSDIERSRKQRRNLESIRTESAVPVVALNENAQSSSEPEPFSEEKELEALRENARYKKYVTGRKRENACEALHVPKRPRTAHDACETKNDVPRRELDNFNEPSQGYDIENQADKREMKYEPREKTGAIVASKRVAPTNEISVAPRTSLDPKILDDSSDEDSDSDGSLNDHPIGPPLPDEVPEMERREQMLDGLPLEEQATLGVGHDSYVSSISLERAGNRMATGSFDSTVKLWDFGTMNKSLRSFKTVSPLDEAPIRSVQFSATGRFLLCSGSANTAAVLDRDGNVISQTMKGDMYIVDMARTKGHTAAISSAKWKPSGGHPSRVFATTATDGTMRLWDVTRTTKLPVDENPVISQLRVVKLRDLKGTKISATSMDWTSHGSACLVVIGCTDGRLRIIDPNSYGLRAIDESETMSRSGTEITCITCAAETSPAPLVLVRSTDDCLRVFDLRKARRPLKVFENLPNAVSETNACFVGSGCSHFITGTTANRRVGPSRGNLKLFSTRSMEQVWQTEGNEGAGSLIYATWHRDLNQIMYGCADGKIRVLYHPGTSTNGILRCLSKGDDRKRHGVASLGVGEVILPTVARDRSFPKGDSSAGAQHVADGRTYRANSAASSRKGALSGPKPAAGKPSTTLAKHIMSKEVDKEWFGNPRDAILRYAEVAEKDPIFTRAYHETQPEVILAQKTAEQEEEESRLAIYERDRLRKALMQKQREIQ